MVCENCGAMCLDDDPFIPLCRRCAPVEPKYAGWRLLAAWAGLFVGAWAILCGIIYLVLQVLS